MHDLYNLRDKLCKELKEYGSRDVSSSSLEIVDKLAHAIKNIDKILDKGMDEYSYRSGHSMGYSCGRDVTMDYVRPDGSYRRAGRDAMGRYSRDDGIHEDIRRLMEKAPDERTREELSKLMERL